MNDLTDKSIAWDKLAEKNQIIEDLRDTLHEIARIAQNYKRLERTLDLQAGLEAIHLMATDH